MGIKGTYFRRQALRSNSMWDIDARPEMIVDSGVEASPSLYMRCLVKVGTAEPVEVYIPLHEAS